MLTRYMTSRFTAAAKEGADGAEPHDAHGDMNPKLPKAIPEPVTGIASSLASKVQGVFSSLMGGDAEPLAGIKPEDLPGMPGNTPADIEYQELQAKLAEEQQPAAAAKKQQEAAAAAAEALELKPAPAGTPELEQEPVDKEDAGMPAAANRNAELMGDIRTKSLDNKRTPGQVKSGEASYVPAHAPDSAKPNLCDAIEKQGVVETAKKAVGSLMDDAKGAMDEYARGGGPAPNSTTPGQVSDTRYITRNVEQAYHLDDPQERKIYEAEVSKTAPLQPHVAADQNSEAEKLKELSGNVVLGKDKQTSGAVPHDKPSQPVGGKFPEHTTSRLDYVGSAKAHSPSNRCNEVKRMQDMFINAPQGEHHLAGTTEVQASAAGSPGSQRTPATQGGAAGSWASMLRSWFTASAMEAREGGPAGDEADEFSRPHVSHLPKTQLDEERLEQLGRDPHGGAEEHNPGVLDQGVHKIARGGDLEQQKEDATRFGDERGGRRNVQAPADMGIDQVRTSGATTLNTLISQPRRAEQEADKLTSDSKGVKSSLEVSRNKAADVPGLMEQVLPKDKMASVQDKLDEWGADKPAGKVEGTDIPETVLRSHGPSRDRPTEETAGGPPAGAIGAAAAPKATQNKAPIKGGEPKDDDIHPELMERTAQNVKNVLEGKVESHPSPLFEQPPKHLKEDVEKMPDMLQRTGQAVVNVVEHVMDRTGKMLTGEKEPINKPMDEMPKPLPISNKDTPPQGTGTIGVVPREHAPENMMEVPDYMTKRETLLDEVLQPFNQDVVERGYDRAKKMAESYFNYQHEKEQEATQAAMGLQEPSAHRDDMQRDQAHDQQPAAGDKPTSLLGALAGGMSKLLNTEATVASKANSEDPAIGVMPDDVDVDAARTAAILRTSA